MLNERGPLMFINTANTKIEKSSEQLVYDSRNPKVKKETTSLFSDELKLKFDERKMKNIIEMYNKNRPVFCSIEYDDVIVEGIPCAVENQKLKVLISDETAKELDLEGILSISIIRF